MHVSQKSHNILNPITALCETANPCQNGAACDVTGNALTCACQLGFTGIHCETGITWYVLIYLKGVFGGFLCASYCAGVP